MAPRKPQPVVRPVKYKREVVMCDGMMCFYLLASSLNLKSMHYKEFILDFKDGSRVALWVHKTWPLHPDWIGAVRFVIEKWIYRIDKTHSCFVNLETREINFDV